MPLKMPPPPSVTQMLWDCESQGREASASPVRLLL